MNANSPQERPPGFTYLQNENARRNTRHTAQPTAQPTARPTPTLDRELHAEEVPLTRLAERFGTPLYVYSAATIRVRYQQFDQAFRDCEHTVCYSIKANSNLSILRLLARLGAGFDIVSGGELQRVIAVSRKAASRVVFSGVGKQTGEVDAALSAGILLFNVESASELELLTARAAHLRKEARFAIRVNPDVAAKTHPYIATGLHEHKFGVPWRDAPGLYRRGGKERWLKPAGVSVHIGSQITEVAAFREALDRVASLVRSLRGDGLDIRYVDAGGGLGISYEHSAAGDFAGHAKRYARAIMQPMKSLGVHLLFEPGRAIIAPAGVLLTRVIYRKQNGAKRFVIVDAAMNDLIRPALYNAHHEIVPVVAGARGAATETVDVVGPVCESGDFLARDRRITPVEEGDLLAVLDVGAYGMSLASNYNSRPRPAEVLVEGRRARLIRKRESVADLLAYDSI